MLKKLITVTFLFEILQKLSKCFVCLKEGWNVRKTACCEKERHKKCEERFRRTLASYTNACAYCRQAFKDPCNSIAETRWIIKWPYTKEL